MPKQIAASTKKKRCDAIMSDQNRIHNDFNAGFLDKTLKVICEGYDPVSECFFGRSYADAPDIDGKVYFTAPKRLKEGEFVDVKITDVLDYDLYGKIC
jgi:ribosomal protein S12 methylthiotransferase